MKRMRTLCLCSSCVSVAIRWASTEISWRTSATGRDQFSVENEYTVSCSMPSSTASRNLDLSVSAPAL